MLDSVLLRIGVVSAALASSAFAHAVDIDAQTDRILLRSTSPEDLRLHCEQWRDWSNLIHARNGLMIDSLILDCSRSIQLAPGQYELEVTRLVPQVLRERLDASRTYDGLCYNTALISSGLLPLGAWSMLATPVEAILGMESAFLELREGQGSLTNQPITTPAFVGQYREWRARADNLKNDFPDNTVQGHIQPGSILCYRTDGTEDHGPKGDHCLAFVGPDWVVESDGFSAVKLRSWNSSWTEWLSHFSLLRGKMISIRLWSLRSDWQQPLPTFRTERAKVVLSAIEGAHKELELFYKRFPLTGTIPPPENEVADLQNRIHNVTRSLVTSELFSNEVASVPGLFETTSLPQDVLTGIIPLKDPVTEIWIKAILAYRLMEPLPQRPSE